MNILPVSPVRRPSSAEVAISAAGSWISRFSATLLAVLIGGLVLGFAADRYFMWRLGQVDRAVHESFDGFANHLKKSKDDFDKEMMDAMMKGKKGRP